MTYVVNVTEAGVLLRHSVIDPIILGSSDAVRQDRNVDVLVVEWVSAGL